MIMVIIIVIKIIVLIMPDRKHSRVIAHLRTDSAKCPNA